MLRAFEKKIEIIVPDMHFLSLNGDLKLHKSQEMLIWTKLGMILSKQALLDINWRY